MTRGVTIWDLAVCLLGALLEDDAGEWQEDAEVEKENRLCESHKVRPNERNIVCGVANRYTAVSVFMHKRSEGWRLPMIDKAPHHTCLLRVPLQ